MKEYLEKLCEEYVNHNNFSGVCLLRKGDTTIFENAYGYANRAFQIPNNCHTRFDTASITKVFTAAAVLQLVEAGKLKLTDRITELIDLQGTKIPNDVTIEHLLNHTSGIADDADEEAGEDYAALFVDSPNYAIRECRDFLKNFAYKEPNFQAGTNVRYCNCAFVLLGLAIEKVTGTDYRSYVTEHVFQRAGMKDTAFIAMDDVTENVAEGYRSIEDEEGNFIGYKKNIYCYPPIGTPDGGAYTTAGDLDRFIRAILSEKLMGKEYSAMLQQPHSAFTHDESWYEIPGLYEKNGYAFEFFLQPAESSHTDANNMAEKDTIMCMYKDGCNDGVSAMLAYYPTEDMTLVLLCNQECDVWGMRKEIQKKILLK